MKIKWMKYNRKKVFMFLSLFLILFGLTFGYASLTTKISIDGVSNVKDAKWSLKFDNFSSIDGSVSPLEEPIIADTSVTFSAKVNEPGDFYGFTVDVVNEGTINAKIGSISITPDFSNIDYIDSFIEYYDGTPISVRDTLDAGETKKIKVYLKYKEGIDEDLYPTENQQFPVTISLKYIQDIS